MNKFYEMTEDEMADEIVANRLDEDFKDEIRAMTKDEAQMLHHSLGRWIRNTFGLWQRPTWTPVIIDGVDYAEDHPDAISARIIQKIHDKLNDR